MSDGSKIEWTEATWNPIAGCSIVSPGCTNCYAMRRVAPRLSANPLTPHYAGTVMPSKAGPVWTGKIGIASDAVLKRPLSWRRPRMIFVNSASDLFHAGVPDEVIDRIFAVMALCPQHTFQILTKRPERMRLYCNGLLNQMDRWYRIGDAAGPLVGNRGYHDAGERLWPLPNVWLGTSVEDQTRADERVPLLLDTAAAVHFISAEPLIGPITLREVLGDDWLASGKSGERRGLDRVIVGGESGSGSRPMHPAWARSLRDQCGAAGVAFFFKQWGEYTLVPAADGNETWPAKWFGEKPPRDGDIAHMERVGKHIAGRLLNGVEHNGFPK